MKAVFILDDNQRNARQLSQCLQAAGAFDCVALDGLADFRRQSRRYRQGVVLVELVQTRSNGFELAAALLNQSRFPVILVSSRGLAADAAWANARGIQHVVERRLGLGALLDCINHVLQGLPVPAITYAMAEPELPSLIQDFASATAATAADSTETAKRQLRVLCTGLWLELLAELKTCTDASLPWPASATVLWQQLCALLVFLQIPAPADDLHGMVTLGTALGVGHFGNPEQPLLLSLTRTLCRQALQCQANWQKLMQLVLLIQHLHAPDSDHCAELDELCAEIEEVAIPYLYGPPQRSAAVKTSAPVEEDWQQVIGSTLTQQPLLVSETLEHWHISIYQLRNWLDCYIEITASATRPVRQDVREWSRLINVLYNVLSNMLLPLASGSRRAVCPPDLCHLTAELVTLAVSAQVPSKALMRQLIALELSPALSISAHQRAEQQLLASGLRLLSQPAQLVARLVSDHQQAGTLLVELRHELKLLLEGAKRWKVVHVESLVTLLVLCYQRIEDNNALLAERRWRLVLGRAHRYLCRLLDHAAVWQTPVRKNEGSRYSRLLDDLFLLLDPEGAGESTEWQHCLRLNRRIRLLMDLQQHEQIDCSALLRTLVIEQHKLLQRPGAPPVV